MSVEPAEEDDLDRIGMLSVATYILALVVCFLLVYYPLMSLPSLLDSAKFVTHNNRDSSDFREMWTILAGQILVVLGGAVYAAFLVRAARCLKQRRRYKFCQRMAVVSVVLFPAGTVLGLATLAQLRKEHIRVKFSH